MSGSPARGLRFRLLGPVGATLAGRPVALGPPQQRCVLTALLLEPGRTVSADRLLDVLWDQRPSTARKTLQVHVSNLRRVLADDPTATLSTDGQGYRLDVRPAAVDLHRCRRLVRQAEANDGERARRLLHQAQRLWVGAPLTGVGRSSAVEQVRSSLLRERLALVDARIRADLAGGHISGLVPELNELLTQHPLDERLHESLMRTLWADGRVNEALAVFRDVRTVLAAELGVEPGPVLAGLHRQLLQVGTTNVGSRTRRPARTTLPADMSDFCGRDEEIDLLGRELASSGNGRTAVPVMVVAGPGGIGKTSLAIHVAHTVRAGFPDGILFVTLAGTRAAPVQPAAALAILLRDLGVAHQGVPDSLADRSALFRSLLADREVLVVLDDALDATQVAPLLPGSDGCAALVTSRSSLAGLDGTRVLELGVLRSPDAVRLFRGVVGNERTDADLAAVDTIVAACGHFPLAVRLASARFSAHRQWTPQDFLRRLHPDAILDELSVADVAVRTSFALSYDGMDGETARAFRLLSLPEVADFSVTAAAALLDRPVADTERLLERLTDGYLLQSPSFRRYRYHDLLRLFGRTMADRYDSAEQRRTSLSRFVGYQTTTALNAAAWLGPVEHSSDRPTPPAYELASTFDGLSSALRWLAVDHVSTRALAAQAVDLPGIDVELFVQLTFAMSGYREYAVGWQDWHDIGNRALVRARREQRHDSAARAQAALGRVAIQRNDLEQARRLLIPAVAHFRDHGLHEDHASTLMYLAVTGTFDGHFEGREAYLQEVVRLRRTTGNVRGVAAAYINLASLRNSMGDHQAAKDYLVMAEATGYPLHANTALSLYYYSNLGGAERGLGDYQAAARHYERTLTLGRQYGNRDLEAITLLGMVIVHVRSGFPERALGCFRDALALQHGKPPWNVFRHLLRGAVDNLLRFGEVTRECLRHLVDEVSDTWWPAYLDEL